MYQSVEVLLREWLVLTRPNTAGPAEERISFIPTCRKIGPTSGVTAKAGPQAIASAALSGDDGLSTVDRPGMARRRTARGRRR